MLAPDYYGAVLIVSLNLYSTPVSADKVDRHIMRVSSISQLYLSLIQYLPSGNSISFKTHASILL